MQTNSIYPYYSSAASADGKKLFTMGSTSNQGDLYVMQFTPAPQLNLAISGKNLALSWLVSSTKRVLQRNVDLTSTNWLTLTNTPVLNSTNLRQEVILSPAGSSGYYRLTTH